MSTLKNRIKAGLLATMGLLGATLTAAQADTLKDIYERGSIRVGVQGAFKPWSYPAPDGKMTGIEVDIATKMAEALGVTLEPVIITSANRMDFLQQGRIDLIIGGMYDTAERRKVIGIVEPAYWTSGPTLMAKKGVVKDWEDIRGKPVCAKQGVAYNSTVEKQYDVTLVAFAGNTEGKEALRAGRCIALLYDDVGIIADLAEPEWAEYEMPVPMLYSNPWGAAVPLAEKDSAFGLFVSGALYRMHANGDMLDLSAKYNVPVAPWIQEQKDALTYDRSYLEPK